ncbi:hypothetical protein [Calothrix rhizosoleniae]|uniref:hypothetical protein n=1 Tax=Calothrix rhizosoleniae TaxID=888997 RepID=UPI001F23CD3E|nr:hypothetical protein [Calothrix rhizosoleniae]
MIISTKAIAWNFDWRIYPLILSLALSACGVPSFQGERNSWKTYKNSRYGFEFPYPSNWEEVKPDNDDGIVFISPQKKSVEIRGWAGNQLLTNTNTSSNRKKSINPNFKNIQGIAGVMTVEIGTTESIVAIKFNQGGVKYYWQGKAPSSEFNDYYRFFYYIAQHYRLPQ